MRSVLFVLLWLCSSPALPASYDLRTVYPRCLAVSGNFTQGECNSCWAASLSSAWCIISGGNINTRLSVEMVLSCSVYGCVGYPTYAYDGWLSVILGSGNSKPLTLN